MKIKEVISLLLLLGINSIVLGQAGREEETPLVMVSASVEVGELEARRFPGTIVPVEEVDIVPRVTGYIEKVNFKEGDVVKAGDLLFQIEEREYVANLKKAQANVASCKSQILQTQAAIKEQEARIIELEALLKYKTTNYNRNLSLFKQNKAVSEDEVDNAKSTMDAAVAQRDAAIAMLAAVKAQYEASQSALSASEALADLAAFDMDHTQIKAPISGKIGKVTVTKGNLVTPQFGKMVDIRSISPIYARFAISERLFRSTYEGEVGIKEKARIRLELADNTIYAEEAVVALVDNKVDKDTNTIMIWGQLKNSDMKLLPGSFTTILLCPKSDKPTCGVLLSAVQTDETGNYVYVVNQDKTVSRRNIQLGVISAKYHEITSGVKPGEIIIVEGMNKVRDGQKVETLDYKDND